MRDRTRDLEHIQECETADAPRRAGAIMAATGAIVALTFAVGMVVGRAEEPAGLAVPDPLERLANPADPVAEGKGAATGGVEAADLTFPQALTGEEDRPEVLAALRAAAREEESLDGEPDGATVLPAATAAGRRAAPPGAGRAEAPNLPSHEEGATAEAAPGEPGEFMLQVLSYDDAAGAQKFARELRSRGHRAYVGAADIPGRGRTWRVRIGPFTTMREGQAYRRTFEAAEAMNSFVVRRRDEE
jgi:cell division septation protein DedD